MNLSRIEPYLASVSPDTASMPALNTIVRESLRRLEQDLAACPVAGEYFWQRARELGGGIEPDNLFLHPLSTPVLLFPWWVEESIAGTSDLLLQSELAYASINLLYYVRLLDDAMDGHYGSAKLLPALTFLHSRFQGTLQKLFPSADRFWAYFYTLIDRSTEVTVADFSLSSLSASEFLDLAAQKSCCALIPIAAVVARYGRYDCIDKWFDLWNAFSAWNQMRDDLLDWHRDLTNGTATYLLSEGQRRKMPDEDIPQWMLREGFDWARNTLDAYAHRAAALASAMGLPAMERSLGERYLQVAAEFQLVSRTLAAIGSLGGQ